MAFSIHSIYSLAFKLWREKRYKLFLSCIQPQPDEEILDVGGEPVRWTARPLPVSKVLCLNKTFLFQWNPGAHPEHPIDTAIGDGCALEEADQSYPIVYSNSVIEHVGNIQNQREFAKEVRRVGQRLWVQTPAFECPLEPHFLLPFVHWLPVSLRTFVIGWFSPWAWLEKPTKECVRETIAYTQLLTKRQMRELFPDCEILTERMLLVIPKSYIAVRKAAPAQRSQSANSNAIVSNLIPH